MGRIANKIVPEKKEQNGKMFFLIRFENLSF